MYNLLFPRNKLWTLISLNIHSPCQLMFLGLLILTFWFMFHWSFCQLISTKTEVILLCHYSFLSWILQCKFLLCNSDWSDICNSLIGWLFIIFSCWRWQMSIICSTYTCPTYWNFLVILLFLASWAFSPGC